MDIVYTAMERSESPHAIRPDPEGFRLSNQICYGMRCHFSHRVCAMCLDGGFAKIHLRSNVLVHQASHYLTAFKLPNG
jgi:hypothetical protein